MTNGTELTKAEQVIAFFVQQLHGKDVGRTALMKYLYLADYESRRFFGKPVSDVEYIWYHHGPYDTELNTKIGRLKDQMVIREEAVQYPTGQNGYLYRRGTAEAALSFTADEYLVMQYVCEQYSHLPLQALLADVVYETEPMREAKERDGRNTELRMSVVDNLRQNELGLPFSELLERSRHASAGELVPFQELESEHPQSAHAA